MFTQTDNLIDWLEPYGIGSEEARIYLYLLGKRVATALNISRNLHIGRTKVYRLLDRLIEKSLVVQQCDSSGFKFVASDPAKIETLLFQKENEIATLKKSLPDVLDNLKNKVGLGIPGSQILYYRGKSGLAQVNWNVTHAKGEFNSYEITTANAYLPYREAEKLRRHLTERKIMTKTLSNKKNFEPFTEVAEMVRKYWQIRYIPASVVSIEADIFIYNDVYAVCHYLKDGDIFCFEMYNEYLAKMQKQLFENLWKQAKKLKILSDQGMATLGT